MFTYISGIAAAAILTSTIVPEENNISDNIALQSYARSLAKSGQYTSSLQTFLSLPAPSTKTEVLETSSIALKANRAKIAVDLLYPWKDKLNKDQFWLYITALERANDSRLASALVERLRITPQADLLYKLYEVNTAKAIEFIKTQKLKTADIKLAAYEILTRTDKIYAVNILEQILAMDPRNLKALHYKGYNITQPREAIEHYEHILILHKTDYASHRVLHRLYFREHKYGLAAHHKQIALQLNATSKVELEDKALSLVKKNRPREALNQYKLLAANEPENVGAQYSMAGLYNQLGELTQSLNTYGELEGNNLFDIIQEVNSKYGTFIEFNNRLVSEDAPSRLANIVRWESSGSIKWISQEWNISAGPVFWLESPKGAKDFTAQGGRIEAAYRISRDLAISGEFTSKAYNQDIQPTFSGNVFGKYSQDWGSVELGVSQEDVLHNEYAFFQKTQGTNLLARVNFQADRLEMSLANRGTYFSDNNLQLESVLRANWTLIRNPGTFKIGVGGSYLDSQFVTVETIDEEELSKVKYPYWTPKNYLRGTIYLDWEQNLSRNSFSGQKELSYALALFSSFDNDNNLLVGGGVALNWEIRQNWRLQAATNVERSAAWNGASLTLTSSIKF